MKAPAGEPDGANYTVAVVRYEDMLAGDVELWSHIAEILTGGPTDENRVADAIVLTGFRRLQAREREEGFVDQRPRAVLPIGASQGVEGHPERRAGRQDPGAARRPDAGERLHANVV